MIWIGIGGIVVMLLIAVVITSPGTFRISGLGLLGLFVLFSLVRNVTESRVNRGSKEARRAYRGAKAEEHIEDILNALDIEKYAVYHDVPSAYGNIDHVVISRQHGVFLIETKSHGGKVSRTETGLLVNGKPPEKDFIAQAVRNAMWLRDQIVQTTGLKVWITPIIVFTNAFVEYGKPIRNVEIINKKYLLSRLQRNQRPNSLNETLWTTRAKVETALQPIFRRVM